MGDGRVRRIGRGSIVCRRSRRRGCRVLSRLGRRASGLWVRVGGYCWVGRGRKQGNRENVRR